MTLAELNKLVDTLVANSIHAEALADAEAYEKYNGIVGTCYDEETYNELDADYLYSHIPGGVKLYGEASEDEDTQVDAEQSAPKQEETPKAPAPVGPDYQGPTPTDGPGMINLENDPFSEATPIAKAPAVEDEEIEDLFGE